MAVSIVLGKANSGKTVCCFRAMEEAAAKGKKVLLIVPDQGTYEAERRYAESLQGRDLWEREFPDFRAWHDR